MSAITAMPTEEQIRVEIAVATSLEEKYGTNEPAKTYEQGVADALLWVLGGQKPFTVLENQTDRSKQDENVLQLCEAGKVVAPKVVEPDVSGIALLDAQYDNERLIRLASESPSLAQMVRNALAEMDEYGDQHFAIWLGSFMEDRPKTQVQLLITQHPQFTIDED